MNELQIFENPEFGSIRTIEINQQPYWVAVDVANALGYKRTADAVRQHCKQAVKHRVFTKTGEKQAYAIPESDLYRLIVHSKLPGAERFERWVFDEVLPTIRKTGEYRIRKTDEPIVTEDIKKELSEIKQAILELTRQDYLPVPVSKGFIKANTKEAYRKSYINYLLTALEQMIDIPRMEMLHQAYQTLERETNINLGTVKQEYNKGHNTFCVSMLDAICGHEQAVKALLQILHFNMELALSD